MNVHHVIAIMLATTVALVQAEDVKTSMLQRTGGFIVKPLGPDEKVILLVDTRKTTDDVLPKFQEELTRQMHIASVIGTEAPNAAVKLLLADAGGSSVDFETLTATVSCGKTDTETNNKLFKALLCIFASQSELLTQEGLILAQKAIAAQKLGSVRRATYKQACREGWAPAPTNDYQRAIWETAMSAATNAPTARVSAPTPPTSK